MDWAMIMARFTMGWRYFNGIRYFKRNDYGIGPLVSIYLIITTHAIILLESLNNKFTFKGSTANCYFGIVKGSPTSIPTIGLPLEVYTNEQTFYTSKVRLIRQVYL